MDVDGWRSWRFAGAITADVFDDASVALLAFLTGHGLPEPETPM